MCKEWLPGGQSVVVCCRGWSASEQSRVTYQYQCAVGRQGRAGQARVSTFIPNPKTPGLNAQRLRLEGLHLALEFEQCHSAASIARRARLAAAVAECYVQRLAASAARCAPPPLPPSATCSACASPGASAAIKWNAPPRSAAASGRGSTATGSPSSKDAEPCEGTQGRSQVKTRVAFAFTLIRHQADGVRVEVAPHAGRDKQCASSVFFLLHRMCLCCVGTAMEGEPALNVCSVACGHRYRE
eukprot:360461-Chlamydomonas_euryale.AAC.3